ncbi:MAG: hypothetical protein KDD62_12730, partial [Bdellovibrionales bacterium]|nr:hypothetical protein [Bdellovibrionales bacterium]
MDQDPHHSIATDRLIDLVFDQSMLSHIGNLLNGLLLVIVFFNSSHPLVLGSWFSILLLVTVIRWSIAKLKVDYADNTPPEMWLKLWIVGLMASGACWGAASILLFDSSRPDLLLFLSLMLGGLAAGSIPLIAPVLGAARLYVSLLLVPLGLSYLLSEGPLHYYMAALTGLLLFILLKTAKVSHLTIMKGARLQDENSLLVHSLEQEREDIELLNEELKVALITAEDLAEAKDQFLATVSHELRTPMNAVIGMLELVLSHQMPHEQRECLNAAHGSAGSLMGLIDSVLDFSKIQTKDFSLEEESFVLRNLLEEMEQLFGARLKEKSLQYYAIIDPEVPTVVRGDSLRLRQVFINLIGNSIKFTNQYGVIIL